MVNKVKAVAIVCVVLLLSLALGSFVSFDVDVASGSAEPWWPGFPDIVTGTENVTWDFYVVAGVNTSSPMLSPAPQPPGFNFTVAGGRMKSGYEGTGPGPVAGGFDFGNVTWRSPEDWISNLGWVKVNITNLLDQDIVITNMTAEVTNSTETDDYLLKDVICPMIIDSQCPPILGNHSLVWFDALDPYADENDYYTGVADPYPYYDGEGYTDARSMEIPNKTMYMPTGPLTLLGPDSGGDAAATGHVAPILLRNGEDFTEYFGVQLFGNATSGTNIYGTITLTITYRKVVTPSSLDVVDVSMYHCNDPITEAYNTWTVQVNVTVKNIGTSPINNISVSLYGLTESGGNLTHWTGGTLEQVGTTQTITSLDSGANTTLAFSWNLANAPFSGGSPCFFWWPIPQEPSPSLTVPVRAVAVSVHNATHIHYDEFWSQIDIIPWGDINDDGTVNISDLIKWLLIYAGYITEPEWMIRRADLNGDCKIDASDIIICLLIVSGFLC